MSEIPKIEKQQINRTGLFVGVLAAIVIAIASCIVGIIGLVASFDQGYISDSIDISDNQNNDQANTNQQGQLDSKPFNQNLNEVIVKSNNSSEVIIAEVADTSLTRQVGLMNRVDLPEKNGMLFVFDQPQLVSFWMKDTLIPLDIIFINENREIVKIVENAEPNNTEKTYSSNTEIKYVLEINGGKSEEIDYTIGDILEFSRTI